MEDILLWLQDNRTLLICVVVVIAVLEIFLRLYRGTLRLVRRRRAPQLNPKLQKYAGRSDAEIEADRLAAEKIISTSSTATVAGYEIVRQIEAVFVEGLRSPGEATSALKASAGKLGANAVINLSQERTAAGRCTAQGDAVVVRPLRRAPAGRKRNSGD
ncbi:MAG: hypothetical protein ABII12_06635 [Planctomycetota bacterium]